MHCWSKVSHPPGEPSQSACILTTAGVLAGYWAVSPALAVARKYWEAKVEQPQQRTQEFPSWALHPGKHHGAGLWDGC